MRVSVCVGICVSENVFMCVSESVCVLCRKVHADMKTWSRGQNSALTQTAAAKGVFTT